MIQLPFVGTRHEMTEYNSSMESGSSVEETSSLVHLISNASEASMWEGWTQASNGDEVATGNLLPELMGSSRLAYHQTDMLSSWLSGFHPLSQGGLNVDLSHNTDSVDNPPAFMQESLQVPALCSTTVDSLADMYIRSNAKTSSGTLYSVTNDPCEDFSESYVKRGHDSSHFGYGKPSAPLQLLQSLDPESPSSPLALHNGLLHSFGGSHWDGGHHNIPWPGATGPLSQSQATTLQLLHGPRESTAHVHQVDTDHIHAAKRDLNLPNGNNGNAYYNDYHPRTLAADHSRGLTNHLGESFVNKIGHHGGHPEVFIGSQGNYGWAPHYLKEATQSCVSPIKLVPSVPDARESNIMSTGPTRSQDLKFLRNEDRISGSAVSSNIGNCTGHDSSVEQARPGKHRLELVEVDGEDADSPPLKRPSLNDASQALWRNQNLRRVEPKSYPPSSSSLASQAMDIIAVGPALNTNGKPRARRGSATDPQSVYARHRRERINERLKTLQHLVPNGAKVDIVTMLEEAINYVKFLQDQLKLLKSDEFWIYATPNIYNGIDVSNSPMQMGLESSA